MDTQANSHPHCSTRGGGLMEPPSMFSLCQGIDSPELALQDMPSRICHLGLHYFLKRLICKIKPECLCTVQIPKFLQFDEGNWKKKITKLYQNSRMVVKPTWICGCHSNKNNRHLEFNQDFCDVWMNSYCKFRLLRVNCLFNNLKTPWHPPPHPLYVQGLNNQNQIFSTTTEGGHGIMYDELRT